MKHFHDGTLGIGKRSTAAHIRAILDIDLHTVDEMRNGRDEYKLLKFITLLIMAETRHNSYGVLNCFARNICANGFKSVAYQQDTLTVAILQTYI